MEIYKRIKDLREDRDLKQSEIAKILNTTQSYYAQYENGKRQIPFERMVDIAEFYDVSLDYIAGRTNDKKGLSKSNMSSKETDIIKKFRYLNDERKGEVLGTINLLFKQEQEEQSKIQDIG